MLQRITEHRQITEPAQTNSEVIVAKWFQRRLTTRIYTYVYSSQGQTIYII